MPALLPKYVLVALVLACAARGGDGFTGPLAGRWAGWVGRSKLAVCPLFFVRFSIFSPRCVRVCVPCAFMFVLLVSHALSCSRKCEGVRGGPSHDARKTFRHERRQESLIRYIFFTPHFRHHMIQYMQRPPYAQTYRYLVFRTFLVEYHTIGRVPRTVSYY